MSRYFLPAVFFIGVLAAVTGIANLFLFKSSSCPEVLAEEKAVTKSQDSEAIELFCGKLAKFADIDNKAELEKCETAHVAKMKIVNSARLKLTAEERKVFPMYWPTKEGACSYYSHRWDWAAQHYCEQYVRSYIQNSKFGLKTIEEKAKEQ